MERHGVFMQIAFLKVAYQTEEHLLKCSNVFQIPAELFPLLLITARNHKFRKILRKLNFCTWFYKPITFCSKKADEACFSRNGTLYIHNTHTWTEENPHLVQHTFSASVFDKCLGWHAILAHARVILFFFLTMSRMQCNVAKFCRFSKSTHCFQCLQFRISIFHCVCVLREIQ